MTATLLGGIMPNSVTTIVTYSAGIASYFRLSSDKRGASTQPDSSGDGRQEVPTDVPAHVRSIQDTAA